MDIDQMDNRLSLTNSILYKTSGIRSWAGACLLLLVLLTSACFGSKKTTGPKPVPPKKPVPEKIDTIVTIPPMDTLQWSDADTSLSPVLVQDDPEISVPELTQKEALDKNAERIFKDEYHITVLLPFFARDSAAYQNNRPANWSLDFYLGFKLAFQKSPHTNARFVIQALDTRANPDQLQKLISKGALDNQDVIVGPYRSNLVATVADYVKDKPTILLSPYSASSRAGKGNSHYLQMNPALETHMRTTWKFLKEGNPANPVIFIHGKSASELSKKELWQSWIDSLPVKTRKRYSFKEFDEAGDMAMEDFLIDSLLQETVINNIVFPSWDETNVQAIMSKISSGIAEKNVRLFGLPQWIGFERISPSYFESLQVHLTSTDYVDDEDSTIRTLKSGYKAVYAQPMNEEAIWGYRCGQYLATAMAEEGALFQRFLSLEKPVKYPKNSPRFEIEWDVDGTFLRIENQNIYMLRFADGRMVLAK
ncbi:MAG: hypothetical protein K9I85_01045 [Saprospiraceae bacterium]|nr:hypothetical protein [Saprospiraceae bacterium]